MVRLALAAGSTLTTALGHVASVSLLVCSTLPGESRRASEEVSRQSARPSWHVRSPERFWHAHVRGVIVGRLRGGRHVGHASGVIYSLCRFPATNPAERSSFRVIRHVCVTVAPGRFCVNMRATSPERSTMRETRTDFVTFGGLSTEPIFDSFHRQCYEVSHSPLRRSATQPGLPPRTPHPVWLHRVIVTLCS